MSRWGNAWGGVAAALAAALLAAPAAAQQPARGGTPKLPPGVAWQPQFYNPAPAADDLVLPMPCGGAMAFRRVDVPKAGALDDRRIVVGGSDARFSLAESSRDDFIDGAFTDPSDSGKRFYYLAKYETSTLQAQAVAATPDKCPTAALAGRMPASGVTWFEAVQFAQRYGEWLMANARAALPGDDGMVGFVRLPTEAEWEYAARGGVAVSTSEFEAKTFPMPEGGMEKYVAFQGPRSANNRAQLTGLLAANPLGLHDMLGNVDEIVLDAFRVNKFSRLHGQAGGVVIKGGNFLTSADSIRSAYRQELLPFDAEGKVRRAPTVGFRVAVAGAVIASRKRLEDLAAAQAVLPKSEALRTGGEQAKPAFNPNLPAVDDPLASLAALAQAAEGNPQLQQRITAIQRAYAERLDQENNMRADAAKSLLRLGAFMGQKLREDADVVNRSRERIKALRAANASPDTLALAERAEKANADAMQHNLRFYADTVAQMAADFTDGTLAAQQSRLKTEFEARGVAQSLLPLASLVLKHVTAYRKDRGAPIDSWLADFVSLRR